MTAVEKRERLKQERRETIIAAAVRVFLARSVQAATMDEIAREASVSKGALYLYFSSKDELFLSVALDWLDDLQRELDALLSQSFTRGIDLVRAGAVTYCRHALANPARFQVAMSWLNSPYSVDESAALFQDYRAAIAQKYQFLMGAMERAQADGSLVTDEPLNRLGVQLWGAVLGLILVEQSSEKMARRLPVKSPTEGICVAFIDNFLTRVSGPSKRQIQAVSLKESRS